MVPFVFFGVLVVVLLVLGAGMLFQGRRAAPSDGIIIYGVDDSVEFVWERLSSGTREELRRADVRRILEWEMHYLQQPRVRGGREAIVAGTEAATYAQERAWEAGFSYEPKAILEVMDLQGRYLEAIGAIGDEAAEEPQ